MPLKKEMFSVVKTVWTPSPDIYRHLHFKGSFKVKVDETHSFLINHYGFQIENKIFWEGLDAGWEKTSIRLWKKLVTRADVIFDIGANTGLYALIAKSLNTSSKVFAFDPVQRVYERLLENIKLNNYEVDCFQLATSNNDGDAIVYDLPTEHILSVTVNENHHLPDFAAEAFPINIKTIRLDTFIGQQNLERIDLMKIDVERHEFEVLDGMGCYLEKFRPNMLIEILSNEIGKKVESLVSKKGYLYFRIDDEDGMVTKTEKILIEKDCNFLLCDEVTANELGLM